MVAGVEKAGGRRKQAQLQGTAGTKSRQISDLPLAARRHRHQRRVSMQRLGIKKKDVYSNP